LLSGSLAVAAKLTVAGAVNVWPEVGLVRVTVGGRLVPVVVVVVVDVVVVVVVVPVQATPLRAKLVGCGNGLGGAEPDAERVQVPCRPTLLLVAPVPIEPFHPASVAVTAVVPVKVAFQPPVRVCPLGSVNVSDQWLIGSPRLVIARVVVKPPDVGDDCHALVFVYVTEQPEAAAEAGNATTAAPANTSAPTAADASRAFRWLIGGLLVPEGCRQSTCMEVDELKPLSQRGLIDGTSHGVPKRRRWQAKLFAKRPRRGLKISG
jgi:hypothetical protein